jgi:hypothetical protein
MSCSEQGFARSVGGVSGLAERASSHKREVGHAKAGPFSCNRSRELSAVARNGARGDRSRRRGAPPLCARAPLLALRCGSVALGRSKRCSPRFSSRSGWRRTTRSGGGCDGETRRSLRRGIVAAQVPCSGRALLRRLLRSLPFLPKPQRLGQLRPSLGIVRRDHRVIKWQ